MNFTLFAVNFQLWKSLQELTFLGSALFIKFIKIYRKHFLPCTAFS
jgi:hypothetical protein